jgi:chemotaxis protein CheD
MENVRMGELAVSSRTGDELVAIGLGSCIGRAMIDRDAGVAGLAHVVLPESQGKPGPAAKFADLAVPEMVAKLVAAGATERRLEALMIGGARMFSVGESMDIGFRNAEAVRAALQQAGVRLSIEEVGGNRGRTARIVLGAEISSQLAGGERTSLMSLQADVTRTAVREPAGIGAKGIR